MKKTVVLGIVALLLVGLVAMGVFAFQSGEGRKGKHGNEAARNAVKEGNYGAWKEAMTAELTEERFSQLAERHQQMEQRRAEMEEAIENGYSAWKEAVADSPGGKRLTEVINEDNFDRFVEMHEARKNGDFETANAIAEELGLQRQRGGPGKGGRGRGGLRAGKCKQE